MKRITIAGDSFDGHPVKVVLEVASDVNAFKAVRFAGEVLGRLFQGEDLEVSEEEVEC